MHIIFYYIRIGLEIVHVTLNDENTHNNITTTITRDLTPCVVIVPFLTAIWGIQPSGITIIKRVDPITAPSLVRRRIKANVYCNQCYWHEFIIKHLASLILYSPPEIIFKLYFPNSKQPICNIAFVQVVPKLAAIVWLRVAERGQRSTTA